MALAARPQVMDKELFENILMSGQKGNIGIIFPRGIPGRPGPIGIYVILDRASFGAGDDIATHYTIIYTGAGRDRGWRTHRSSYGFLEKHTETIS